MKHDGQYLSNPSEQSFCCGYAELVGSRSEAFPLRVPASPAPPPDQQEIVVTVRLSDRLRAHRKNDNLPTTSTQCNATVNSAHKKYGHSTDCIT